MMGSTETKDRPILDLAWDYGDEPDMELVACGINGYVLEDVKDSSGKVLLVGEGKVIPGFGIIARPAGQATARSWGPSG